MVRQGQIFAALVITLFSLTALAIPSDDEALFSNAELDQLLAPVALYPDTVLSHILIAATYPLEVVQAERWASKHPELEGDEALARVEDKDWDPSVKALVPFPHILTTMSEDLDWTQSLGEAFLQDEARVMSSIQTLRERAQAQGHLESGEHQRVSHEDDSIVIESVRREVVYVPYYDPRVVYGNWWWPHHPPHYWAHHHAHYPHHSGSIFIWMPSLYVHSGFYFHSSIHWRSRHVVAINHHSRHRVYGRHQIVHHRDAQRWQHNPHHRRGVNYRNAIVRERYRANTTGHYRSGRTRSIDARSTSTLSPRTPERTEGDWAKGRSTAIPHKRHTSRDQKAERKSRPQSRTHITGDSRVHKKRTTQERETAPRAVPAQAAPKPQRPVTANQRPVQRVERTARDHQSFTQRTERPKRYEAPPQNTQSAQNTQKKQSTQNTRSTKTYSNGRTSHKTSNSQRGSSQRNSNKARNHSRTNRKER